jgi:WhiB family transcriptional regulator, redox-sensing transcriptional regulator
MAVSERTALDWRHQARCALPGVDPDLFYPDPGQRGKVSRARRICARCPVQAPCLEEALGMPAWLDEGVRAGLTAKERSALRAQGHRRAGVA